MMFLPASSRSRRGFSLLELSAVLIIISILLAAGIGLGSDALKAANRITTTNRLAIVQQALDNYAQTYGHLPCPADRASNPSDSNFGTGLAPTSGGCNGYGYGDTDPAHGTTSTNSFKKVVSGTNIAYIGAVPVRTLGLPDTYAGDAWGNKILYAVSANHVNAATYAKKDPAPVRGTDYTTSVGNLTVMYNDRSKDNPDYWATTGATYVLVSHGPDGRGAWPLNPSTATGPTRACVSGPVCTSAILTTPGGSCNDIENCDDGAITGMPAGSALVFWSTTYNDGKIASTYFDDYIVWGHNLAQRAPVAEPMATGSLESGACTHCEPWCAPCTKNYIGTGGDGSAGIPPQANDPKLCQKVMISYTPTCSAACFWAEKTVVGSNTIMTSCP